MGQGALGIEVRRDDEQTINLISFLDHKATRIAVTTERAFLKELEGGCQVPIAGLAQLDEDKISFQGLVAELDGSRILREEIIGTKDQAEEIGIALARKLLDSGAGRILERIYGLEQK